MSTSRLGLRSLTRLAHSRPTPRLVTMSTTRRTAQPFAPRYSSSHSSPGQGGDMIWIVGAVATTAIGLTYILSSSRNTHHPDHSDHHPDVQHQSFKNKDHDSEDEHDNKSDGGKTSDKTGKSGDKNDKKGTKEDDGNDSAKGTKNREDKVTKVNKEQISNKKGDEDNTDDENKIQSKGSSIPSKKNPH